MIDQFNPNDISVSNGNYFALPFSVEQSRLVLMSVPWDTTCSYRPGCSKAPDDMITASEQIDLYDIDFGNAYVEGIGTLALDESIMDLNNESRKSAEKVIDHLSDGGSICDTAIARHLKKVNDSCQEMVNYVYSTALDQLKNGKIVGLVGGDHSTPFGLIKALATQHNDFGILHIDAHADLRVAYEGFTYSHASIMHNVLEQIPQVSKLVQIGIRDFCEEEFTRITSDSRIETFFDRDLSRREFEGESWRLTSDLILSKLPKKVYVSFDIDGLESLYCPNTGTPVAGGISYQQAIYLLTKLAKSDRHIIGFDLNEVGHSDNSDWDANVGARVVYKLACATVTNNRNK